MDGRAPIQISGLVKAYGSTRALDGVDLEVRRGTLLALLGPNGAGKTTLTRILATLAKPTAGRALVAGFDVALQAGAVRRLMGVTGQSESIDTYLTGRQNLVMVGELSRLARREARSRAAELLERFELLDAADRRTKTYSGGMRRKLDLALSLVTRPQVLLLDEPTTGLDPRARIGLWELIRELTASGTTLLLTTQYLDEADQLADQVVVIDRGRLIAQGTPDQLKSQVGGTVLELQLDPSSSLEPAVAAARSVAGSATVDPARRALVVPSAGEPGLVTRLVRALDEVGIGVDTVETRRPGLDDVFLKFTGHRAADEEEAA
ncbi:MAG: ATP-binding cassette domain-containing protein [Candidatus Dormibacteria bacterium]